MLTEIRSQFVALKKTRRKGDPLPFLTSVGHAAADCLTLLGDNCDVWEIGWEGSGSKTYDVFALAESDTRFSRAVNRALFLPDRDEFEAGWKGLLEGLEGSAGKQSLDGIDAEVIDRLYYTAVIGFAASVDVFGTGDRGGPGTFFEMAVGPALEVLTGRGEQGHVRIRVPEESDKWDKVPVDLSFPGDEGDIVLVVPTKISTRERISQAFVHQAILNRDAEEREFRSALCIGNENNMFVERGATRSVKTAFARDTLVADTIVLYHRYIAELAGLYYLDPPTAYLAAKQGFPPVRRFSALLTEDLPMLLAPTKPGLEQR